MRPAVRWAALGASVAAAAAGVVVIVAVTAREPSCEPLVETPYPLDLSTPGDRAHLAQDLRIIRYEADRFSDAVASRPLLSESPDALQGARTAPPRARAWCERTLADEVAQNHRLDSGTVRQALEQTISDPLGEREFRTVKRQPHDGQQDKGQHRHPRE